MLASGSGISQPRRTARRAVQARGSWRGQVTGSPEELEAAVRVAEGAVSRPAAVEQAWRAGLWGALAGAATFTDP